MPARSCLGEGSTDALRVQIRGAAILKSADVLDDGVLRESYGVAVAPAFAVGGGGVEAPLVTRVHSPAGAEGGSSPMPYFDGFGLLVRQRRSEVTSLVVDGRAVEPGPMEKGTASFFDLRCSRYTKAISPFSIIHFKIPRSFLNDVADQEDRKALNAVALDTGLKIDDPVFAALGNVMEDVFTRPQTATTLFVDDVTIAVVAHLVKRYCAARGQSRQRYNGLTWAQMQRTVELLDANLSGDVSLVQVAADCGLPTARYRRAFRESFGAAPHIWLERRRIDRALRMLRHAHMTGETIAIASGFGSLARMNSGFGRVLGEASDLFRPAPSRRPQ